MLESAHLIRRPEFRIERGKSELNALVAVSESPVYNSLSASESHEGKPSVTAAELVAGLSRDMERIELALRKLMLLR